MFILYTICILNRKMEKFKKLLNESVKEMEKVDGITLFKIVKIFNKLTLFSSSLVNRFKKDMEYYDTVKIF